MSRLMKKQGEQRVVVSDAHRELKEEVDELILFIISELCKWRRADAHHLLDWAKKGLVYEQWLLNAAEDKD